MASDPDAALMLAFQGGDERAFRTLFDRHGRAMVSFCHHYVRDAGRAEELAQDVFLKVHRSASRYQATARFKTWLYRIAANHCLNELRRGEYSVRRETSAPRDGSGVDEPLDLDSLPGSAATPEEAAMGEALAEAVRGLLARLPEKQRTAFVLCRLEGLAYEEIAEVLETSVSAVKSLIHRATVAAAVELAPWSAPDGKEVRQ